MKLGSLQGGEPAHRTPVGVQFVWLLGSKQWLPSICLQPKFWPPLPGEARKFTSSQQLCPTSATYRLPVVKSKQLRHALRSPYAKISPQLLPLPSRNGFENGI